MATDADAVTREELYTALEESIKLQVHYAKILNCYDGGGRCEDFTAGTWLLRLKELGKIKKAAAK